MLAACVQFTGIDHIFIANKMDKSNISSYKYLGEDTVETKIAQITNSTGPSNSFVTVPVIIVNLTSLVTGHLAPPDSCTPSVLGYLPRAAWKD